MHSTRRRRNPFTRYRVSRITQRKLRPHSKRRIEDVRQWLEVGEISLLQIQTGEMTGAGAYDTDLLFEVDRMRLTPDGVNGLVDGAWIVDRHHRHHPAARHWHPGNALSFGFTSHYDHMWDRFSRTPLGIAGENVIVGADDLLALADIAGGLRIETDQGQIHFDGPQIAEPCVEFTRFISRRPNATAREIKPDRELLRQGVRGFVVGISAPEPFEIAIGDRLAVLPQLVESLE